MNYNCYITDGTVKDTFVKRCLRSMHGCLAALSPTVHGGGCSSVARGAVVARDRTVLHTNCHIY